MKNLSCLTLRIFLPIFLIVLVGFHFDCKGFRFDDQVLKDLKYTEGTQEFKKNDALPRILNIITRPYRGGIVTQTLARYESCLKKGYDIILFVPLGSMIEQALIEKGLPFYSGDVLKNKAGSNEFNNTLYSYLLKICMDRNINIIHCHKDYEYELVKTLGRKLKVATIAQYHSHQKPKLQQIKKFDSFIASSPRIADYVRDMNKKQKLQIKHVEFIHPPHNEDTFLNFSPKQSREAFFYDNFGITIGNVPVICVIANIDPVKKHTVLFKAIDILVHQEKVPVHVVLAGGDFYSHVITTADLKKNASDLNIQDYVHFVGFTHLVPELLYYSDIKVLPSKLESFGIVLLEAALMKKPIILSDSADVAGFFIQHEKTGLLFKSGDANDLAYQIKRILGNPHFGRELGNNAYNFALSDFSNQAALDKFEKIYQELFGLFNMHIL